MRNAGKIMIVAAVATALAACSPSREEPTDLSPSEQPTHTPAPVSISESAPPWAEHAAGRGINHAEQAAECTADDITVDTSGSQPRVTIPRDCAAPGDIVTKELEQGSGAAAAAGSTVEVNYQVVGWSDGAVAENTFGDQPERVTLGEPRDIEGWAQGLEGIRQGGTRLIVLPPDLGYSAQGGNPLAGESLVIVAEAVRVA
ncbi:FKBP-type peptidyl-prolyl cis-trans isomerase [Prauserella oleivorans]|uniref:Peptidyl-prolyl cis-trans isomerase n=1 Tax=Prauserella oleivorans TaxID=1478153 RepID=A0ABW5W441_9PSEU